MKSPKAKAFDLCISRCAQEKTSRSRAFRLLRGRQAAIGHAAVCGRHGSSRTGGVECPRELPCPCHHPRSRRHALAVRPHRRSEEHTSELQSLMRISYAVFCLKKKKKHYKANTTD